MDALPELMRFWTCQAMLIHLFRSAQHVFCLSYDSMTLHIQCVLRQQVTTSLIWCRYLEHWRFSTHCTCDCPACVMMRLHSIVHWVPTLQIRRERTRKYVLEKNLWGNDALEWVERKTMLLNQFSNINDWFCKSCLIPYIHLCAIET